MELEKIKGWLYIALGLVAAYLVWQLFKKFGILPDAAKEKEKEKQIEELNKAYKNKGLDTKEFLKQAKTQGARSLFNSPTLNMVYEKLHKSMRGWGTDENTFFASLNMIKNKGQLSQVANLYYVKNGKTFLEAALSEFRPNSKDRAKFLKYINSLK